MKASIQAAVFGATGYSGFELVRLLSRHAGAKKPMLVRRNGESGGCADLSEAYPQLLGNGGFPLESFSWQRMKDAGVDVVFFATPHEFSRELAPEAIAQGFRVIDLSGAWRLKQADNRKVYGFAETQAQVELDSSAVYGLPELHADEIKSATLLANPGCYSTSIILALAPWIRAEYVDVEHGIICDSKSGVSGAGKSPTAKTHFVEVDGNFCAYSVFGHRVAAVYAPLVADPARHPFDDLREAGAAGDVRRTGADVARVLCREAVGTGLRSGAVAADQVLPEHQLLRHWFLFVARRQASGAGVVHR
jgi:N-acetyl-gamma-glutamyl-phosphate reductase